MNAFHLHMFGFSSFNCIYTGNTSSHKINKLQENTSYHFRICAKNDTGTGLWSDISTFTTTKAAPNALKGKCLSSIEQHTFHTPSFQLRTSPISRRLPVYSIGKLINHLVEIRSVTSFNFKSIAKKRITPRFITVN